MAHELQPQIKYDEKEEASFETSFETFLGDIRVIQQNNREKVHCGLTNDYA
jgi:hypothetical protein